MIAVLARARSRAREKARAWAGRRHGRDGTGAEIDSRRVYILPTRPGFIYALIVFTMLLGAMNYNNNMGFALTFLLAGLGVVSIHHCHHNLVRLRVRALGAAPVTAGEPLAFRFVVENPDLRERWQLALGWDGGEPVTIDLDPVSSRTVSLALPTGRRGPVPMPRLTVATRYPLGLLRAWAWLNLDGEGLAWPRPASAAVGADRGEPGQAPAGPRASGDDDFSGLREWRPGDPPRRIAWKLLARTGQTVIGEYDGSDATPVWIDWDSEPGADTEQRLARLARRVWEATAAGRPFGLRLPDALVPVGSGTEQGHACLGALALFGCDDRAGAPT